MLTEFSYAKIPAMTKTMKIFLTTQAKFISGEKETCQKFTCPIIITRTSFIDLIWKKSCSS